MQVEVNRRFSRGFTFNASYTLLDQKGSGFDTANSSLGGTAYNQFHPENDFARDAFVSRHRFVTYGTFETPDFQRQSRDFAAAVKTAGKPVQLIEAPNYHHLEMAESLGNPYGPNGRAALALMKLAPA